MTSTVRVSAHCTDNKHVEVKVNENGSDTIHHVENSQVKEFLVYDDKSVTVKEVVKE